MPTNTPPQLHALSIQQPWIEQIARGRKIYEVRSRRTSYRGPLVLCASLRPSCHVLADSYDAGDDFGVTVCLVDLVDCIEGKRSHLNGALIDPSGQFCWVMHRPRRLPAVPVKGRLGVFVLPPDIAPLLMLPPDIAPLLGVENQHPPPRSPSLL